VWIFAAAVGNRYARWYASFRQTLPELERRTRDTTFLWGRGGDKIRNAWRDIGPEERARLIQATLDSSFPNDTYGIMDERKAYPGQRKKTRVTDEPMPTQPVQHDTQLQTRFAEMERAGNNYYTVLSKEQGLRIHAAYNGGNMVGIIEAAVAGAQNAVVLARIKDKPKTVEDAFSAVALRLDDVLAVLMGTAQFEPDPEYDQPDPRFAAARIRRAKRRYVDTKSALYKLCVELGADEPGEIVIGNRTSRFVGRV
ncbi:hypothetical protein PHYSODRAFT_497579, partial [Phytophthora sojae]